MEDQILTIADVAKYFSLHPQTIRRWIKAGSLPRRKPGGKIVLFRSDIEKLLEKSSQPKSDFTQAA